MTNRTRGAFTTIRRSTVAAIWLVILSSSPAFAQDVRAPYAKEGAYVGFAGLLNFNLDAQSFDGETVYKEVGGEELSILPRLHARNLPKFIVGFRATQFALEFSYERGRHDASFFEFPVGAVFNSVNIDGRFFFLKDKRFQPHFLIGLAFPWLTVEDGSFESDQPDAEIGDSRYRGPALNTEIGLTTFVTPRAGVSVGYAYRFIYFNRERGVSGTVFELKPSFKEASANVTVMGFFTF